MSLCVCGMCSKSYIKRIGMNTCQDGVHLSVDVFIDIVRCVPGALSADAGGAGDPAAAHGADAGPVSEEGPRAGPEQSLSPAERLQCINTYIIMAWDSFQD